MPQPTSPHSFPDCRAFMDKAISSKIGTRAIFQKRGLATSFRLRCYTARNREQNRNKKLYEKDESLHGASVWDRLVLRLEELKDGRWAVAAVHDEEAALRALGAEIEEIEPDGTK